MDHRYGAILDDVKRRLRSTLVPRPRQAPDGPQYRWYPIHGYQQDQSSAVPVPSRLSSWILLAARPPPRTAQWVGGLLGGLDATPVDSRSSPDGADRESCVLLDSRSHINVPLQPRRLIIAPAAVGCKRMLGAEL